MRSGALKNACRTALPAMLLTMWLGFPALASALVTIGVHKGTEAAIPVAIVPFGLQGAAAEPLTANPLTASMLPANVIEADLAGSGRFDLLPRGGFLGLPHNQRSVQYKNWRLLKAEMLVVGQVTAVAADRYEIRFQLLDVFREKQLAGQKFVVPAASMRKTAHRISDIIYEKLLGKPGAFDTRIAYITVREENAPRRYLLQVADSDGFDPKTILESPQPIMSPAWSPDGSQLAYVSFEKKRSMIYVQNLWSGARARVAEHAGINSAPAWSPEGRRLALTLSKEGNPEIHILDLDSGSLRRLTRHTAIDTEPAWSPDGGTIAFTSNRSGTPQIYRIAAAGGAAQRVTFNGKYNAGASYSGDGKSIALITNQGNGHRVGLYSAENRTVTELTETTQDESPTFAPNGEMIMYATQTGGRDVIATVAPDGSVRKILPVRGGAVREPAWSPMGRNL